MSLPQIDRTSAVPRPGGLLALLEQSHDLLAVTDAEGRVVWTNARFRHATGIEDTPRARIDDLIAQDGEASATRKFIARALLGGVLSNAPVRLAGAAGATLHLLANAGCEHGQVYWAFREDESAASAQLSAKLEKSRLCFWRHDFETGRVTFDVHAQAILPAAGPQGLTADEFRSHIHSDDLPRELLAAQSALNTSQPVDSEVRFRRADGGWRYVLTRRIVERNAKGTPLAQLGVSLDVTEQIADSQRSGGQAHRLDAAAQAARVGIWSVTVGPTPETDWNAQMYELFDMVGAARTPSLAEWVDQCVHAQDRKRIWNDVRNFLREGTGSFECEFRALRRDGMHRWMVVRAALDTSQTQRRRLWGIAMDVTEQHNALHALRGADERAALAARLAGIGTWVLDLAPTVERWDEQMFRLRGLEPRDTPPMREERMALLHPDDAHVVLESQHAALSTDDATHYEFRVRIPDGTYRWLASRSIPVRDERGRTVRRVGVNWDITEAKTAEVTRQQKLLAERENKAKSQFLSRMSHELRTPLNAVLGFTQLLQQDSTVQLGATQVAQLGHIRSAGEHLLALINDMLDLSSLEAGRLRLDLQPVSLDAVLGQVLALVEPLAARHQVQLVLDGGEGVALADPTRLRQILLNLLSNALKYNRPQGKVTVTARAGEQWVTLIVRDTGRGLSAHQLSHLFEPFNRLGIESEGIEGAGIGLVIVKGLTQAMGGTISVSSQPGEGTQFQVVLPAASPLAERPRAPEPLATVPMPLPSEPAAPGAAHRPELRRGQILYIEDNEVNVLLVEQLVRSIEGLNIVCEVDGTRGVERARALRPDLILLDMQLPDFDGFEVLEQLRGFSDTAQIPCIALSANAMPEDIARAMSVGFKDYWTKPIDHHAFRTAMRNLFPLAEASAA